MTEDKNINVSVLLVKFNLRFILHYAHVRSVHHLSVPDPRASAITVFCINDSSLQNNRH